MKQKTSIKLIKKIRLPTSITQFLVLLQDGRLAVGIEGLVYIYNLIDYKCELIFDFSHYFSREFNICQLSSGKLIGWCDIQVMFWTITNNSYNYEYFGDKAAIDLIEINNNVIVIATGRHELLFINSNPPYNTIRTLYFHRGIGQILYKVQSYDDVFLCYNGEQSTVGFFDSNTHEIFDVWEGIEGATKWSLVELNNNKLSLGTLILKIYVFDLENFEVEAIISFRKLSPISSVIKLDDGRPLYGTYYGSYILVEENFKVAHIIQSPKKYRIRAIIKYKKNVYISMDGSNLNILEIKK